MTTHPVTPGGDHRTMLLVGLPRSGTTWVARSLAAARSVDLVLEPDNEGFHPLALGYKRGHRFPSAANYCGSGLPTIFDRAARGWHRDPRTPILMKVIGRRRWQLEAWIGAQSGGPDCGHPPDGCPQHDPDVDLGLLVRACRRVMPVRRRRSDVRLIKSVHAVRTVEPIAAQLHADVLLVVRNPFAVVTSLLRPIPVANWSQPLPNADRYRGLPEHRPGTDTETRAARQVADLLGHVRDLNEAHPEWALVAHDELCRAPAEAMPALAAQLDLDGFERIRRAVVASDGPGTGYHTQRRPGEQIDGWKKELTPEQVEVIGAEIDHAGLWPFLQEIGATGDR